MKHRFEKILIANRGEIALRILRTCRRLGIETVAVYSDADADALHVRLADEAMRIGPPAAQESYLDTNAIFAAAKQTKADALHPGYGFLSESPSFARACVDQGLIFIGPQPKHIEQFGLKDTARQFATDNGIPVVPGSPVLESIEAATQAGHRLGYPVVVKDTAGGGGIGMTRCEDEAALRAAFLASQNRSQTYFQASLPYLEKYIQRAHHVEVQIFGDGQGGIWILGERECSIQRRYQKLIEETPSPTINAAIRDKLFTAARHLGEAACYASAGTVEFLVDGDTGDFYFLEVNTRIQVEHTVTEMVTGLDIVELMICQASGQPIPLKAQITGSGHAIEARLYAEDPLHDFTPMPGRLTQVNFPAYEWARTDTGIQSGDAIPAFYDPLIAKLVVHGQDRNEAVERLQQFLRGCSVGGTVTNLDYLRQMASSPKFVAADTPTSFTEQFAYTQPRVEIESPGFLLMLQDWPGRVGYWDIGVPPSGPMDPLAFRMANQLLGNAKDCAALECMVEGPTLRFLYDTEIALTGAHMEARLDGEPVPFWTAVSVPAGARLEMGAVTDAGYRTYLAIRGGIDEAQYLGSRATFQLGQMGGLRGKPLEAGDIMLLPRTVDTPLAVGQGVPESARPQYQDAWDIGALYGPHGAPDFLLEEDITMFFDAEWTVHHNSNRLGIRLSGPKPKWARNDGGEAGLHPSNIHDCVYAIGSVNFTGDMPIILAHDGPSLGGFVCPVTIPQAEIWKIGQVKPKDTIRFRRMTYEEAVDAEARQNTALRALEPPSVPLAPAVPPRGFALAAKTTAYPDAVILAQPAENGQPAVTYRMAGDHAVLIEYGPMTLDLMMRARVHILMQAIHRENISGIAELSPGVRSLQIRYDSQTLLLKDLIDVLTRLEGSLPAPEDVEVPSRIIRLPLAFDDRWNRAAIKKYRKSIREKAPYLPSNIEFIARANGLAHEDDVRQTVAAAEYLVLGLGDVYLGAPCAVPVDPRHRLITSKYNPARMYTPEGSVGIGGVYMCIYGMDSPGGYQLIGRSLPIWDAYGNNPNSQDGKPWLLRFFDRVRFHIVSDDELETLRRQYRQGRMALDVENSTFSLAEYQKFLHENADDIALFQDRQQNALQKEIELWKREGMIGGSAEATPPAGVEPPRTTVKIPPGSTVVRAKSGGMVFAVHVAPGDRVEKGQTLVILEAMKIEMTIAATTAGTIQDVIATEGSLVNRGEVLVILESD